MLSECVYHNWWGCSIQISQSFVILRFTSVPLFGAGIISLVLMRKIKSPYQNGLCLQNFINDMIWDLFLMNVLNYLSQVLSFYQCYCMWMFSLYCVAQSAAQVKDNYSLCSWNVQEVLFKVCHNKWRKVFWSHVTNKGLIKLSQRWANSRVVK